MASWLAGFWLGVMGGRARGHEGKIGIQDEIIDASMGWWRRRGLESRQSRRGRSVVGSWGSG